MALGRTYSVALVGLNGYIVEVEADIGQTLPAFIILGLPDASLNEAKERIRSAAQNSGIPLSRRKITANLIPASLPKRGSGFDLAIAMAALLASNDVRSTGRTVFVAELGLDGRLRPVRGVLPAVMAAVRAGYADIVVAQANAAEAQLVPGARVQGYATLARLAFDFGADPQELALDFEPAPEPGGTDAGTDEVSFIPPDMCDVSGQGDARRALEVAAAGAHHLLLTGPPGAGKTMLAERLPGLLPDLGDAEAMEVTAIHSLCSLTSASLQLVRRPPYENPHHTATSAAIIGGGSGLPRPGAASRAHRGVLFLDEAPEYERRVLDALRQPLESGELVLHRSAGTAAYPARFQLVLAANPCPCGKATGKGSTASAPPQCAAGIWPGCPGRCWTGSTSSCRSNGCRWPTLAGQGRKRTPQPLRPASGPHGSASSGGCCRSGWRPTPRCRGACCGVPCGSAPPPPGSWTMPWSVGC